jgi:hypothetical protein
MSIYLKQSTASQEIPLGYFVDSTDGNTEETALTIANTDIKLWKAGATTLANKNSGGGTHISNGIYYAVLDATDTDTLGSMIVFVHVSGALPVRVECVVLAANVYDSLIGGGDLLQVDATQFAGRGRCGVGRASGRHDHCPPVGAAAELGDGRQGERSRDHDGGVSRPGRLQGSHLCDRGCGRQSHCGDS